MRHITVKYNLFSQLKASHLKYNFTSVNTERNFILKLITYNQTLTFIFGFTLILTNPKQNNN